MILKEGHKMNLCHFCKKEVEYMESLYLRGGREVHITCFQKKRDFLKKKSLSNFTVQTCGSSESKHKTF